MKISSRQICFIMIAYTAATKLLMYPTLLSMASGNDLLFSALIDFFIGTAVIWSISFLCSRTDKTFFELIKGTLGEVTARIVFGFFAAFFLLSTLLPIFEQVGYIHNIFYDTVPSLGVFLPFFVFTVYAATKKFTNIGRCADICLPIFAVSILFIFITAFSDVQWDNLMPILKTPALDIFRGAANTAYTFAEPCWLLMFMGHFKYKKGDAAKITLSYALGAATVLLFLAMFYGIYGAVAPSRTYAIARTSLFFPAIEVIGRMDLLVLFVLEIVMLFALVLNIQLAVYALVKCTGYENRMLLSFSVNGALLAITIFCNSFYNNINELFYNWMWIMYIVFVVALPVIAWLFKRRTA